MQIQFYGSLLEWGECHQNNKLYGNVRHDNANGNEVRWAMKKKTMIIGRSDNDTINVNLWIAMC